MPDCHKLVVATAPIGSEIPDVIPVLLQTEALVVVDKPSGIVVHPGWAQDGGGLLRRLQEQVGETLHPVHRLDRGASGALAFARSAAAAAHLGQAFAAGTVHKRYLAITRDSPGPVGTTITIDHPIPAREDGPRVAALTRVRCLGTWQRYALIQAMPLTGRLHQIRRHLKHVSCPLIGDANYGKGDHNRFFRTLFGLTRLALHCYRLVLPDPRPDDDNAAPMVCITCSISGSLAQTLSQMGLMDVATTAIAAANTDDESDP